MSAAPARCGLRSTASPVPQPPRPRSLRQTLPAMPRRCGNWIHKPTLPIHVSCFRLMPNESCHTQVPWLHMVKWLDQAFARTPAGG